VLGQLTQWQLEFLWGLPSLQLEIEPAWAELWLQLGQWQTTQLRLTRQQLQFLGGPSLQLEIEPAWAELWLQLALGQLTQWQLEFLRGLPSLQLIEPASAELWLQLGLGQWQPTQLRLTRQQLKFLGGLPSLEFGPASAELWAQHLWVAEEVAGEAVSEVPTAPAVKVLLWPYPRAVSLLAAEPSRKLSPCHGENQAVCRPGASPSATTSMGRFHHLPLAGLGVALELRNQNDRQHRGQHLVARAALVVRGAQSLATLPAPQSPKSEPVQWPFHNLEACCHQGPRQRSRAGLRLGLRFHQSSRRPSSPQALQPLAQQSLH